MMSHDVTSQLVYENLRVEFDLYGKIMWNSWNF